MDTSENHTMSESVKMDAKQPHHDGTSDAESGEAVLHLDPVKETKLLAKLDLAFTPIIMLVYLVRQLLRMPDTRLTSA